MLYNKKGGADTCLHVCLQLNIHAIKHTLIRKGGGGSAEDNITANEKLVN